MAVVVVPAAGSLLVASVVAASADRSGGLV